MKSTIDSGSRAKDATSKISVLKTHHFNTETFNQVSQLPKSVKQSIIRDGEMLVNAPEWCEEVWKTLRKNDFASQGALNMPIIENIYKIQQKKFEKMLNVHSAAELYEIMDADQDGSINEDEQVLLFSVIKEKMIKVAESLCSIQEYIIYRDVMKSVRKLELQIAKYQEYLRTRIYKSELDVYKEIGESKFEEFYEYYENEFKDLNTYSVDREAQMRQQHEDQMANLIEKLDRAVVAVKFKPKTQLKEYQTQEKLVSIDERVEEALNFRKELKDLEVSEAHRINKLRINNIEKQRIALLNEQKKEMEHLISKLKNEENKLIIRMKRDFDVLHKKVHLHENEIKKIQGLAGKYAMQKALNDGELKRMKAKSKKMNDVLIAAQGASNGGSHTTKNANGSSSPMSSGDRLGRKNSATFGSYTLNSTDFTNRSQIDFVKSMVKSTNVVQFNLKKSYGQEPPVNVKPANYAHEDKLSHKKVEIYLHKKVEKKDQIPNLTSLYDAQLKPIEKTGEEKTEKMSAEDKKRSRQFINEKLNGDRKIVV